MAQMLGQSYMEGANPTIDLHKKKFWLPVSALTV